MTTPVGILAGMTAAGKSALAMGLAQAHGEIEIINADSLNVYRGMNIGTAKPQASDLRAVPHHLIDVRDPGDDYNAGDFRRDALRAIEDIERRGRRALIVGGTGFYLEALIFGMWEDSGVVRDPEIRRQLEALTDEQLFERLRALDEPAATQISPGDRYRLIRSLELAAHSGLTPSQHRAAHPKIPDPRFRLWVIDRSTEELTTRIQERTREMLKQGFVEEVEILSQRYPAARALQSVGYHQVANYLRGRAPEGRKPPEEIEGLISEIELATRQLVKKQRTWFRGQVTRVPGARWINLPQDLPQLQREFESCYGPSPLSS